MLKPNDFTFNHLFKIDNDPFDCPHCFFFYSNGVHTLLIKRLRNSQYAVCGLGTSFTVIASQNDIDIYFTSDDLLECIAVFESFVRTLLDTKKPKDLQGVLF